MLCNEIVPGLFLGPVESFLDDLPSLVVIPHNVKMVIRCLPATGYDGDVKELERARVLADKHNVVLSVVSIDDDPSLDIYPHLAPSVKAMEEYLSAGAGVLVHCQMGISRSATIVVAYVIWKQKITLDEALLFCVSKRDEVSPNPGFIFALVKWEEKVLGRPSEFDARLYARFRYSFSDGISNKEMRALFATTAHVLDTDDRDLVFIEAMRAEMKKKKS